MLHDEEVARDIVHDVFSSILHNNLDTINTSYLLKAVRFSCLKYIRSLSIQTRFIKSYSLYIEDIESDDWSNEEDLEKLKSIIENHLSEKNRYVLQLKFNQQLKYKQIAEKLSISEVAVYKHLHHALTILRQYFENDEK